MEDRKYTEKELKDFAYNSIVRHNINLVEKFYELMSAGLIEELSNNGQILAAVEQQYSNDFPQEKEEIVKTLFDLYSDGSPNFMKLAPKLKEIEALEYNWDGYNAEPVHPGIIFDAVMNLQNCEWDPYLDLKVLDFYPNPSGTMTFDWCIPGNIEGWDLFISLELGVTYANYYSIIRKDGIQKSYRSYDRIVKVKFEDILDECVAEFDHYLMDNGHIS